jgi:hypothetical protein
VAVGAVAVVLGGCGDHGGQSSGGAVGPSIPGAPGGAAGAGGDAGAGGAGGDAAAGGAGGDAAGAGTDVAAGGDAAAAAGGGAGGGDAGGSGAGAGGAGDASGSGAGAGDTGGSGGAGGDGGATGGAGGDGDGSGGTTTGSDPGTPPGPPVTAAPDPQTAWLVTASGAGAVGDQVQFDCPAREAGFVPPGGIWGGPRADPNDGPAAYHDASSVCNAAVHAGRITYASGGSITIEMLASQPVYEGSTRNGVTSDDADDSFAGLAFKVV